MKIAGPLFVILLAALYVLLAVQAEPVTATLGFIAAGLLTLSAVMSVIRS